MESEASSEDHLPEYDFDPEKLDLRVRVTLAADRKSGRCSGDVFSP